MPKTLQSFPKNPVSSLFSISIECVVANLPFYKDSLKCLPAYVKESILRKVLRTNKYWHDEPVNHILSVLIHSNLKHIDLSLVTVDDETLEVLTKCCGLTNINLRNCGNQNQNFSNQGLRKLFQQTRKLLILDIAHCQQFDDSVVECLSVNCQNLHELCAEGCNLTDNGLNFLAQYIKKIKYLTISNTYITGVGLSKAVENKNWRFLQELRLDSCLKIDDNVLKSVIQNCPKIEILTFYNCAITDETSLFQDITKTCKKLKQLHWTINW